MPHAKCSIYEDGRNKGGSFCHTAFCCIAKKHTQQQNSVYEALVNSCEQNSLSYYVQVFMCTSIKIFNNPTCYWCTYMSLFPHRLCAVGWLNMYIQKLDKCYLEFNKIHIFYCMESYILFIINKSLKDWWVWTSEIF